MLIKETKYLPVTEKNFRHIPSHTETGPYAIEILHSFTWGWDSAVGIATGYGLDD
jgi:hypothetical protein